MTNNPIRVFAPAKINLTLHVTEKRPDGYHLLDSLVVFARDIGDWVNVAEADHLSLTVTGPTAAGVPTDGTNLVLRAAELLRELRGITAGAEIHLEKHLPHGAGIGGGSSDAAATIKALAALWDVTPLTAQEAVSLGADVPVCLGAPHPQHMTGIGETLTPVTTPDMWMVLANPGIDIPTGEVFSAFAEMIGKDTTPIAPLPAGADIDDFSMWLLGQHNSLTPCASEIAPEIPRLLSEFWALDEYLDADMSGSGSTCWGLFETKEDADIAVAALTEEFPDYWVQITRV